MVKKKSYKAKNKIEKPGGAVNAKKASSAHRDMDADLDADFEADTTDTMLENRIWGLLNIMSELMKDEVDEGIRSALDAWNKAKANAKSNEKVDKKANPNVKPTLRQLQRATTPQMIYQLKISVHGLKPPTWFRLLISADSTFYELDTQIRREVGWSNAHLHDFSFKDSNGRVRFIALSKRDMQADYEESTTPLRKIFELPVKKIRYSYNFSRSLELDIVLEKTIDNEVLHYPEVIKKVGMFPDEDGDLRVFTDDIDGDE